MKPIKIKYSNRIEYHNKQGQLHREDGPAVEWKSGIKEWYINGERHREDGPAIDCSDGSKTWYLNGIYYSSEEEWQQEVTRLKLKRILDL
jgi:hypothetical protein